MSATATSRTPSKSEDEPTSPFPAIETMDDVVTNFFNQIVQYVIDDMVVVETNAEDPGAEDKTAEVVKDYKELRPEDLVHSEIIAASGSKVTLGKRSMSRSSLKRGKSSQLHSHLGIIKEEATDTTSKTSTTSSFHQELEMEDERHVRIVFINGNVYEGTISHRIMNGKGRFEWTDGTIYEGHFKDGVPTGKGRMTLPDLSHYEGHFNQGLFHGKGFLNIVSTPAFYSGEWENGMKHGQGWLLYEPGDWYEGGWVKDLKDGFGLRHYKNGAKYQGMWRRGKFDGDGMMIWENNDYYKGEWKEGAMHGQGKYIWDAFYNDTFAFPLQNIYRGSWQKGQRSGEGVMVFGDDTGLKLKGTWDRDFKHGGGTLICGNGRVVHRAALFQYDKVNRLTPEESAGSLNVPNTLEIPIFTAPEDVDVGFYVDKVLSKLENVTEAKLRHVKSFEERCIKNLVIRYLPPLRELYREYASIAANAPLLFEPIMVRLFLWQLYKDKDVWKRGVSLAETDAILAENTNSGLDSIYDPFEPVYFWQFLMSLIGVALSTCCLEDADQQGERGVSASIVKKFFDEIVFAKPEDHGSCLLVNYQDMAPIRSIYSLYRKIGEPHSARTFLRRSCIRKGDPLYYCNVFSQKREGTFGGDLLPVDQHVSYENRQDRIWDEGFKRTWTNLYEFRHLGPKNVVRCLAKACPVITSEDMIVHIDYPLTFLEFYETLFYCIFTVLELEMKREVKILSESVTPVPSSPPRQSVASKNKSNKSSESKNKANEEKKAKKKKKKKV